MMSFRVSLGLMMSSMYLRVHTMEGCGQHGVVDTGGVVKKRVGKRVWPRCTVAYARVSE
jgi:hypothetical protein